MQRFEPGVEWFSCWHGQSFF